MLKIQKLKAEDIPESLKIVVETRAACNKDEAKWLMELSLQKLRHVLKPEYHVLFDDGKIIGISGLYQDYEDPETVRWLDYLAVTPKRQRPGYGTMMLENLEAICRKKKVELLCVFTDNQKAINFYKKHGFETVGKIDHYFSHSDAKVWLCKKLTL
jgi:ribosomal protein S18 acetylase RimI-like enzyme